MTERTYALEDVAAAHLPTHWKHPNRWLVDRLNRGELRGVRFGRTWRMRSRDVDFMLERYANDSRVTAKHVVQQENSAVSDGPASIIDGLSARSRRRVRGVS